MILAAQGFSVRTLTDGVMNSVAEVASFLKANEENYVTIKEE
jgi:hypothetical protein